jgi:serine/threonine protein kinase
LSFKGKSIKPDLGASQARLNSLQFKLPQIAGYEIECAIGRGGMATVYRAKQQSLNRVVAIKVLAKNSDDKIDFLQRIKKEGQILAQFSHPNIITIYDIGTFDDGRIYLSIEYLSSGTLSDRIKSGLSFNEVIKITRSIADALGYAHQRGVIHRDVKPSNIMFRDDGVAVLTDFGVARVKNSSTIHTMTGLVIGSPGYMSPEQAMGEPATIQSDLYGLGVIFYEMLTQNTLYKAESSLAVLLKHINEPIPELPDSYKDLQPLLNRLIAKKSLDRYKNTEEFLKDFNSVVDRNIQSIIITDNRENQPDPLPRPDLLKQKRLWLPIGAGLFSVFFLMTAIYFFRFHDSAENIESKGALKLAEPQDIKKIIALPITQPETIHQAEQLKIQAAKQEQQQQQEEEAQRIAAIAEHQKNKQMETMRKRKEADQYLMRASHHYKNGESAASLRQIEQGLAIVPDHEGLLSLKKEIDAQQKAAQRPSVTKPIKEKQTSQKPRQTQIKKPGKPARKNTQPNVLRSLKRAVNDLNRALGF